MREIDVIDEDDIPATIEYDSYYRVTDVVVCPNCGRPESTWRENDGEGYQDGAQNYCCRGCAEEIGCTCG
ncbi:MAG TPA: hypothetical protein VGQ42_03760 [Candidatus Dormibacteraeota bacterium]|jgi:hypothetical protein|nr:hypothetical protein [Candidatus Dormibacteraeota bacterium]